MLIEDRYGIQSVGVSQDDQPVAEDRVAAGLTLEPGKRRGRLALPLSFPPGKPETTIRVRAANIRGIQSARATAYVRYEAPRQELYLLALGIADYADDALDLNYPRQDVDDLVERFSREEGRQYDEVHAHKLFDGEVSTAALRRAREEFLLQAKPEDTIIVFAAGHGVRSRSGEYFLLTPEATPDAPFEGIERQLLESLVTWDKLHARRRLLLIDTCHSGEAFGAPGDDEGTRGAARDVAYNQQEVDAMAGSGLYILAASSQQGLASESGGNGLFTRALLDGLSGAADEPPDGNGDGIVGISELKTYAARVVHEKSRGRQRPTFPRIEGGENFPIARRP